MPSNASRRAARAALAGAAAMACWAAAEELSSRKTVRVGGLLLLATAAMAGMAAPGSTASVKAIAAHKRIDALVPRVSTNEGHVSGMAGASSWNPGTVSFSGLPVTSFAQCNTRFASLAAAFDTLNNRFNAIAAIYGNIQNAGTS